MPMPDQFADRRAAPVGMNRILHCVPALRQPVARLVNGYAEAVARPPAFC